MASREDADDPLDRGPSPPPASPPSLRPRPLQLETLQRRRSPSPGTPTRGHHRRGSSLTSPPAPPEDFNPPASFIPTECALQGLQAPLPAAAVQPVSSTASHSPRSSLGSGDDVVTSPLVIGRPSSVPVEALRQRPQILALQRLSQESVHKLSHNSSRSSSNDGSDGSDVLAARRDELKSQLLIAELDQDIGRRSSGDMFTRRSSTPPPNCPVEVNVIGATPSPSSTHLTEDQLREAEVEAPWGRPRSGSAGRDNGNDDGGARAWDSVWPAANALPVASFPLQPNAGSRFPSAPLSPYVTPSFSPAVVQTTRRPSGSPPLSPLPRAFGEVTSGGDRTTRFCNHAVITLASVRKVVLQEPNSEPEFRILGITIPVPDGPRVRRTHTWQPLWRRPE
ncbi:hypothetical protein CspeluHIS016_0902560 [Cutaneotrichosporon spelunceum]|uniref:Uncharacterized protein n=1 Tax=Cutaneotrichosporon spelunceum TaxID=1672016 RepID=A0AAD3YFF4_9TREE|nr:hypothetical protein CspeluHIS016_0902560 [Cutaneotrichosporon spelunceum]